ncbi:MAG: Cytochrome b/c1 [Rickettsiales bacterium]|jgi:ubiquinol-cytochrome c reductase cytochrome b/c1 subunit|nr:Cytochrome b/c1 [Rickettsiales bacterium]
MTKTSPKKDVVNQVKDWIEYRLPIFSFMKHSGEYQTPKNLSYMYSFGSMAGIALVLQIITGIILAMHYTPHVNHAFDSVENIMRNVNYGWLIRYTHAVGASMFFMVVYAHIARGLYYGSYKSPREMVWFMGILIFIAMMATAFMGYVLPWGQMSFWGATVITNLFSAFPVVGESIVQLLWGGFSVDNPTLNRFFALHYLLPFVIVALVVVHIVALHIHGSTNPTGVEVKTKEDTIPFHPYYTIKDFVGFGAFFLLYFYFVFFAPNYLGHPDNYIEANPMVTPEHIVPEWYFLPFYAILRAIPDKLGGVIMMFGSLLILFVLPWLDTSKVRSGRYRPLFKPFYWLFVLNVIALGYLGGKPAEGLYVILARCATFYYFAYFLLVLPLLGKYEKPNAVPDSISAAYRKSKGRTAGSILAVMLGLMVFPVASAHASGNGEPLREVKWAFDGPLGAVDRQSTQRGLQVYKEVCASCHSLKLIPFRTLEHLGLSEAEVKTLAAGYNVQDGPNDEGEMFERPARPSDHFPSPFANEKAARASNNGAFPPDLSLIVKARPHGANYLYSLLTGYGHEVPEGVQVGEGMHYNPYFPPHQIAMPQPLSDGQVTYADGTVATVDQMARDVVNFLQWTAEPEMEARKHMGIKVMIYMVIFTVFFFFAKRRVWADVK